MVGELWKLFIYMRCEIETTTETTNNVSSSIVNTGDGNNIQHKKGHKVEFLNITINDGFTTTPPLLSESDLITKMENSGIGTDASITTHIANIHKRGYVVIASGFGGPLLALQSLRPKIQPK